MSTHKETRLVHCYDPVAFVIAVEPVLSLFLELLLPQAMKITATKKAAGKKIIFFILLLF